MLHTDHLSLTLYASCITWGPLLDHSVLDMFIRRKLGLRRHKWAVLNAIIRLQQAEHVVLLPVVGVTIAISWGSICHIWAVIAAYRSPVCVADIAWGPFLRESGQLQGCCCANGRALAVPMAGQLQGCCSVECRAVANLLLESKPCGCINSSLQLPGAVFWCEHRLATQLWWYNNLLLSIQITLVKFKV